MVSSTQLQPGDLLGAYRISKKIGAGGMGVVYEAVRVGEDGKVALKALHASAASDPTTVRRFFAEARAANQVGHPNIVTVYDFVDDEDLKYYTMELLEGETLAQRLRREGGLPAAQVGHIAAQVADTLAAVHEAGIIHRDLKPANIFLVDQGDGGERAKLLDFGVAKLLFEEDGAPVKTKTGVLLGTPAYMAPEQLGSAPIDHRVDIYAFGVILYEMITGGRPYQVEGIAQLIYLQDAEPPTPPSRAEGLRHPVPPRLEALTLQCLDKDPARRPDSLRAVEATLLELSREAASPRPATGSAPPEPQPRAMAAPPAAAEPDSAPTVSELNRAPPPGPAAADAGLSVPRARLQQRAVIVLSALGGGLAAGLLALLLFWERGETAPSRPQPEPRLPSSAAAAAADATHRADGSPDAAVASGAAQQVTVTVETSPPGAAVVRLDLRQRLGTTPLTTTLPRSDQPLRLELRREGYAPASLELDLRQDRREQVVLAPVVADAGSAGSAASADATAGGVGRPPPVPASATKAPAKKEPKSYGRDDLVEPEF